MSQYFKNNHFTNTVLITIDGAKNSIYNLTIQNINFGFNDEEILSLNFFNLDSSSLSNFDKNYSVISQKQIDFVSKTLDSVIFALENKNSKDNLETKLLNHLILLRENSYSIFLKPNFLAGQVKLIEKWPNYDNISLVTVESDKTYKILTNIKTLKLDQKVTIALPGTILYTGLVVGYDKIANYQSPAMFVSAKALNIDSDQVPYSPDLENGTPINI